MWVRLVGFKDQDEAEWGAFLTTHFDPSDKHPPRPHFPNCASPIREGGGEQDAAWRRRTASFSTADSAFAPARRRAPPPPQH